MSGTPPLCTSSQGLALIVEDDVPLRTLLSLILEAHGLDVRIASDGSEALELLRHERPAVIVTDLMMPTLDGWGLLDSLRADASTRDIPIIVTTAVAPESETEPFDADSLQVNALLSKPFSVDSFFEALEAVVKKRRP